jgi:hypothetical protein
LENEKGMFFAFTFRVVERWQVLCANHWNLCLEKRCSMLSWERDFILINLVLDSRRR